MKSVDFVMALPAALGLGFIAGAGLTEMLRAPAPPARIFQAPDCRPSMQHPLDYTVTVTQSGDGRPPVTRYYFSNGGKS